MTEETTIKKSQEQFPNATPRPWKLRPGTSIVCSDDHKADVLIIVGQVSQCALRTKRAQENAALTLEAVNSYDALREALETIAHPNVGHEDAMALKKIARAALALVDTNTTQEVE